jgi:peptidoglycan/LPS O-acetylase OafA/YrhL
MADIHLAPFLDFSGSGRYGVYLFFVLSSFLLTLPAVSRSKDQFRSVALWTRYGMRRFFRIFPLYFIVLLFSYFCSSYINPDYCVQISKSELFDHIILMQGKSIFWTIPVEFKYYFILPIIAYLFVAVFKKRMGIAVAVTAATICLIAFVLWPSSYQKLHPIALRPYLPVFLAGSLAALLHTRLMEAGTITRIYQRRLLELAAILTFLGVLSMVPHFSEMISGQFRAGPYFHRKYVLFGILWSVFILSCLNGSGLVRRALECRPLRFVGIISYSVYLWHPTMTNLVRFNVKMHSTLTALLIVTATLLVAAVSHLLIEKPFMKLNISTRPKS